MHLEQAAPAPARRNGQLPTEWRRLRQDLRQAAQAGGFTLLFQPRVQLRDGALVGASTQLRWPRRRGGVTAASSFMPLLEAYGLAAGVAAWTLKAACQAAAAWPRGQISITADTGCLRQGTLLTQVGTALAESGLAPGRLELDIAEPALAADTDEVLFTLAALRDIGVNIALDAFGSESASLLPLKRLPLTALKLDRSLVRDLPDDREAAAIVVAATHFAHALNVTLVACGVETEAQQIFLRDLGVDDAQGSFFGHAVPAAEIRLDGETSLQHGR